MRLLSALTLATALLAATPRNAPAQFIRDTTPLALGRGFHGSAVVGDYIYVIGGAISDRPNMQSESASVHGARIDAHGNLSKWGELAPIPAPRLYIANSTVVVNDTIYVVGGSNKVLNGERYSTTLYTRPAANGVISRWAESAPFAESGFSCSAAFSTAGYLHVVGGLAQSGAATSAVWSVPLMPDGSLGKWMPAPQLPTQVWFHHAAVVGSQVYVWGGIPHGEDVKPITATNAVYSAPVLANGRLGNWRSLNTTLPKAYYSAASAVAGPYLFSFSPRYEPGSFTNDVWWSVVGPDGISGWQLQGTVLKSKVYHAVVTDYRRGSIYVTGGKGGHSESPQPHSYLIWLSPQARQMAEQAWMSQEEATRASISTMDVAALGATASPANQKFHSYEETRRRLDGGTESKPLVLYFSIDGTKPCEEQNIFLDTASIARIQERALVAQVDVRLNPQTAQQFGVLRVPTWIFYDRNEQEQVRTMGVLGADEILHRIGGANQ